MNSIKHDGAALNRSVLHKLDASHSGSEANLHHDRKWYGILGMGANPVPQAREYLRTPPPINFYS